MTRIMNRVQYVFKISLCNIPIIVNLQIFINEEFKNYFYVSHKNGLLLFFFKKRKLFFKQHGKE